MSINAQDLSGQMRTVDELRDQHAGLGARLTTKMGEMENLREHLASRKGNDPDGVAALERHVAEYKRILVDEAKLGDIITLAAAAERADARGEVADAEPAIGSWPGAGSSGGGQKLSPLAATMTNAQFHRTERPTVKADGYSMLKASTFPTPTDLPRRGSNSIVQVADENRWVWPFMPMEAAGTDLVIQDYKQTGKTLTGTVERAATAVTEKAVLNVAVTSVTQAMRQQAVVLPGIPNALFDALPQLSNFLEGRAAFELNRSLDAHLFAQITAANPPNGLDGANLVQRIRNAVRDHRALGANPTLLVLSPGDAAALDVLQQSDGQFLFGTSGTNNASPMWNLRIVESSNTALAPTLIDPVTLGVLYVGQVEFTADPFTGLSTNTTRLRIEVNGLYHVRNANGAYVVEA